MSDDLGHIPRKFYCYRLYAFEDNNEEEIWSLVQSWQGHMSIRADSIDFFVPSQYISYFLLKYPELSRQYQLDLL